MNDQHETHLHFLVCIDRLNNAWATLNAVRAAKDNPLAGPAFRYALVEYATPYTRSDGPIKRHRYLAETWVPPEYLALHRRILDARSKVHAHADLTVLEAQLHISEIQGKQYISRVQNMIHGLEKIGNIDAIISLVEGTLSNMYAEQEVREQSI
jgi:hypothetical protein